MAKTPAELREELRIKQEQARQERRELERRKQLSDSAFQRARKAAADLHFLGYSYEQIRLGSGIPPSYLERVWVSLDLHIPPQLPVDLHQQGREIKLTSASHMIVDLSDTDDDGEESSDSGEEAEFLRKAGKTELESVSREDEGTEQKTSMAEGSPFSRPSSVVKPEILSPSVPNSGLAIVSEHRPAQQQVVSSSAAILASSPSHQPPSDKSHIEDRRHELLNHNDSYLSQNMRLPDSVQRESPHVAEHNTSVELKFASPSSSNMSAVPKSISEPIEKSHKPPQNVPQQSEGLPTPGELEIRRAEVARLKARIAANQRVFKHQQSVKQLQSNINLFASQRALKIQQQRALGIDKLRSKVEKKKKQTMRAQHELEIALKRKELLENDILELQAQQEAVTVEIKTATELNTEILDQTHAPMSPEERDTIELPQEIEDSGGDSDNNKSSSASELKEMEIDSPQYPLESTGTRDENGSSLADVDKSIPFGASQNKEAQRPVLKTAQPLSKDLSMLELEASYHPQSRDKQHLQEPLMKWPLKTFESWRFSPTNIHTPLLAMSPTFNACFVKDIEDRYYCATEGSGRECLDSSCEDIHFREFTVAPSTLVNYMAQQRVGKVSKQSYRAGLREFITERSQNSLETDSSTIVKWILEYRHQLVPSSFLAWHEWGLQYDEIGSST